MGWATVDPGPTSIQIICDDSGHARGKVAKFDTFVDVGDGWVAQAAFSATAAQDYRRPTDGSNRHNYTCKLCGLSFVCTDATLWRLLDLLAAQGVSNVNLKALNLIASRLK